MVECSVPDCHNSTVCKGLCNKHYLRSKRYQDVEFVSDPAIYNRKYFASCDIEDCQRPVKALGLCSMHYQRLRNNGNPLVRLSNYTKRDPVCSIDGCEEKHHSLGYCIKHHWKFKRYGDATYMKPASEGYINRDGYRILSKEGKKKLEHRWVMEQKLDRGLFPWETVHHINGDKLDNRIENLELWSSKQPSGQRVKDKIAYAVEILDLYGVDSDKW